MSNGRLFPICVLLMFLGLLGLLKQAQDSKPYREVTVVSGEAVVAYGEFHYRIKAGETACGPVSGDNTFACRVRLADGTIRFQPRLVEKP